MNKELVKELFEYRDGNLYWKNHKYKKLNGKKAGCLLNDGYIQIRVAKKPYLAHRLIYLYHHGVLPDYPLELDHINRNRVDNRIENLRIVTKSENLQNRLSISNINGITWHKKSQKWQVQPTINGKQKYLGIYKNLDDAKNALRSEK